MDEFDCPRGVACGIHYRVNEVDTDYETFVLIDYVDNKAVVTQLVDALGMIAKVMLTGQHYDAVTRVYTVGEGTLWDLILTGKGTEALTDRYEIKVPLLAPYDDWGVYSQYILDAHNDNVCLAQF